MSSDPSPTTPPLPILPLPIPDTKRPRGTECPHVPTHIDSIPPKSWPMSKVFCTKPHSGQRWVRFESQEWETSAHIAVYSSQCTKAHSGQRFFFFRFASPEPEASIDIAVYSSQSTKPHFDQRWVRLAYWELGASIRLAVSSSQGSSSLVAAPWELQY